MAHNTVIPPVAALGANGHLPAVVAEAGHEHQAGALAP